MTYQLRIRGRSASQLAREEGVSREALFNAMNASSYYLERVIATALGMKQRELFAERFDEKGRRLGRLRVPNRSTRPKPVTVEKAGAI